jgi:hypothetical protein
MITGCTTSTHSPHALLQLLLFTQTMTIFVVLALTTCRGAVTHFVLGTFSESMCLCICKVLFAVANTKYVSPLRLMYACVHPCCLFCPGIRRASWWCG